MTTYEAAIYTLGAMEYAQEKGLRRDSDDPMLVKAGTIIKKQFRGAYNFVVMADAEAWMDEIYNKLRKLGIPCYKYITKVEGE
jgi:hypothetical protein